MLKNVQIFFFSSINTDIPPLPRRRLIDSESSRCARATHIGDIRWYTQRWNLTRRNYRSRPSAINARCDADIRSGVEDRAAEGLESGRFDLVPFRPVLVIARIKIRDLNRRVHTVNRGVTLRRAARASLGNMESRISWASRRPLCRCGR